MTDMTPPAAPQETQARNRAMTSKMARERLSNQRTASNLQMALPKIRQPLGSLMDKGIPFNVEDPKELSEARHLSRMYYRTHDLVPLLIDMYAKFPCVGLEFQCFAGETPVITSDGVLEIKELAGGVHRVLTTGGKWVEAPFKSFGEQQLMRIVVERNTRQREFFATGGHRWLVERKRYAKAIRRDEVTTEDLSPGMLLVSSYGRNLIHHTNPSPFGIAHGMTFGDGTRNVSGGGCRVVLWGDKDANMLKYFNGCTTYRYERKDCSVEGIWVNDLPRYFKDPPPLTESTAYLYGWLAGYFAADGSVSKRGYASLDSHSFANIQHAKAICQLLGIHTSDVHVINRSNVPLPQGSSVKSVVSYRLSMDSDSLTEKFFCIPEHQQRWVSRPANRKPRESWSVVSVEPTDRVEEVYCAVVPETEAFTLDGNILTGNCQDDPMIEKFYSEMFFDTLNYEEYLPNCIGREYYTVGEANSLGHFDELLGIFSSEEIINPDMIRVSKSLFVQQERVQLLVKEMVERLRTGPQGLTTPEESPSERLERTHEYQQLVKDYPEIIAAAAQDDGLDISDALISRIVNRAQPNDLRGTPHLMRSFRTLMMEESLNAAQDAVADRLYAPLILATLGIENMGDGEPWIPSQSDLDDLRDDMQAALAADFKLMTHNMGLKVESVFGRESVPRFDQDYQRIDSKLLQAWGIGEALIAGGTSGTYASSALNREVCELLMKGFQNQLKRHIRKRCEVIAEAQGHFASEKKGAYRRPLYRDIIDIDPETGKEIRRRVPKLLIPTAVFRSLNLRDESTERAFMAQLKAGGVPVSDKVMALNLPVDFHQELKKSQEESILKWVATAEALTKAQKLCDEKGLVYPPDLAEQLTATLLLRQQKAQTELMDDQTIQSNTMTKQMVAPAAAGMGLLPGIPPPPPEEGEEDDAGAEGAAPQSDPSQQKAAATQPGPTGVPHGRAPDAAAPIVAGPTLPKPVEIPRNRAGKPPDKQRTEGTGMRPGISDEQRKNMPKASAKSNGKDKQPPSKFSTGPSSYGSARYATEDEVRRAVQRLEAVSKHSPKPYVEDLIDDPEFYAALNAQGHESELQAEKQELLHGGGSPQLRSLLQELLDQYEDVFGVAPEW